MFIQKGKIPLGLAHHSISCTHICHTNGSSQEPRWNFIFVQHWGLQFAHVTALRAILVFGGLGHRHEVRRFPEEALPRLQYIRFISEDWSRGQTCHLVWSAMNADARRGIPAPIRKANIETMLACNGFAKSSRSIPNSSLACARITSFSDSSSATWRKNKA